MSTSLGHLSRMLDTDHFVLVVHNQRQRKFQNYSLGIGGRNAFKAKKKNCLPFFKNLLCQTMKFSILKLALNTFIYQFFSQNFLFKKIGKSFKKN